eukprot:4827750-Prymnesium_polylepis.1
MEVRPSPPMRIGSRACSCAAAGSASVAAAVPMMAWKSLSTSSSWRRVAARVTDGGMVRRKYTRR